MITMKNDLTFEQALARLEKIVRELESGETTLDDSIKLFEEGVSLSAFCSERLKNAQQKVEILIGNAENPETAEFKANE